MLDISPLPALFHELVAGSAEVKGGKRLLSNPVASKGTGLLHQGADDVAVVAAFRHGSWRPRLQVRAFLFQRSLDQPVVSSDHLTDEVRVIVGGVELSAAPQDESLVDGGPGCCRWGLITDLSILRKQI